MFYIRENNDLKWYEKAFNLLKINDNEIILPIEKNMNENQIRKISIKCVKQIKKNCNSKKIVLSKNLHKSKGFENILKSNRFEIVDGRWLFELLTIDVLKHIVKKENFDLNKIYVSFLVNDLTEIRLENIKLLSTMCKNFSVVTNHIEKFKKISNNLLNTEGIVLLASNNKRKSLSKSQIIINTDFSSELLNKYYVFEKSIIVNLDKKTDIKKKRFEGIIISDYEIDLRDDKKQDLMCNNFYLINELYESQIYKKGTFRDLRNKLKIDNVNIRNLYSKNSII